MNTKTTLTILMILLLVVGISSYYMGVQRGVSKEAAIWATSASSTQNMQSTQNTQGTQNALSQNNIPANPANSEIAGGSNVNGSSSANESSKPDLVTLVSQSLIGKWQNTQDSKFVREFTTAGSVTDYYNGTVVTSGTWQVFAGTKPLKATFPIKQDAIYVRLSDATERVRNVVSSLDFQITKVTLEDLELIYMEGNTTNTFTRIK